MSELNDSMTFLKNFFIGGLFYQKNDDSYRIARNQIVKVSFWIGELVFSSPLVVARYLPRRERLNVDRIANGGGDVKS